MPARPLVVAATMLGMAVAGCTSVAAPLPSPAAKVPSGTLVVTIPAAPGDTVTADGWKVAEQDLPAYVAHSRTTAVVIRGDPGSPYDRALRIESALQQVGLHNVTIAPVTP